MNRFLMICMVALASVSGGAAGIPEGFVYRGRMAGSGSVTPSPDKSYVCEFRLYETKADQTALWTGRTQISPGTNGLFQVWVSDALRDQDCVRALGDVLANCRATYVGVTFDEGKECLPRRRVLFAPAVEAAERADDVVTGGQIGNLIVTNGVLNVRQLKAAELSVKRFAGQKLSVLGKPICVVFALSENGTTGEYYLYGDNQYWIREGKVSADYSHNCGSPGKVVKKSGLVMISNCYDMPCVTFPVDASGTFRMPSGLSDSRMQPRFAYLFPFGTDN